MEIKILKLGDIDTSNEETINNSIHDEIKSFNADGVQLILEWDDAFEAKPIDEKVRALSVVIHYANEYGYFNLFLMGPKRNVYRLRYLG